MKTTLPLQYQTWVKITYGDDILGALNTQWDGNSDPDVLLHQITLQSRDGFYRSVRTFGRNVTNTVSKRDLEEAEMVEG